MTPPHQGPTRTEVRDLRNIVERLDLLMDATSPSSRGGTDRDQTEALLIRLVDRVTGLESEVEELRTLVNHLMTIATWQARVTATLVDDRAPDPVEESATGDVPAERQSAAPPGTPGPTPTRAEPTGTVRHADTDGRAERGRPRPVAATLDDDIDDILGAKRGPGQPDAPPPDFGI